MNAPKIHDLSNITVLASLGSGERRDFEKSCRWRHFTEGEQIIDQAGEQRDVYFLAAGRVRVVNFTLQGREVAIEDLDEGSYFGELAALDGRPRSSSVVALSDAEIAKMAPERFLAVLKMYPEVALRIMVNLAGMVRNSTERIVDLSTLGANNRVHAELLRRARMDGLDEKDGILLKPIPVHSDMASRAGTTRETVARVLNDLARQGIVKRDTDALVISDPDRLQEIVDEVRG